MCRLRLFAATAAESNPPLIPTFRSSEVLTIDVGTTQPLTGDVTLSATI